MSVVWEKSVGGGEAKCRFGEGERERGFEGDIGSNVKVNVGCGGEV